jgi:ATP-dependent DNA helicase RecG
MTTQSREGGRVDLPVLERPLANLIDARWAKPLAADLDIHTVGQLLRHYPRRYTKRGELTPISRLEVGEDVTLVAKVAKVNARVIPKNGRRLQILTLTVGDGSQTVDCTFFNQNFLARAFPVGSEGVFSGRVKRFNRTLQLDGPQASSLDGYLDEDGKVEKIQSFAGIYPIYGIAGKLKLKSVQDAVAAVLRTLGTVPDPVPPELLARHRLVDLTEALTSIHQPAGDRDIERARDRLRFDEALSMQLVLAQRRARARVLPARPCPRIDGGLLSTFDQRLPFQLTAGQQEVGETIAADLATIHPMNRLLQGEVGSGKTIVALRAMLQVVDAGRQTVLLAPTEVLAAQHARSLTAMLGPLATGGELGAPATATRVTLLTGSLSVPARRQVLLDIASGAAGIVVGTHALLGRQVVYADLGLVVVDEQHRFGVEQRDQLRSKDPSVSPPHVLVMTATPIPRTVAMTVYGDLETSTLTQLPAGRSPIRSTVVPVAEKPAWLERAWQRVHEEVSQGRQVYIVCPRIGGDGDEPDGTDGDFPEASGAAGSGSGSGSGSGEERRPPVPVIETAAMLVDGPLAGLRVAVLHGRLPPAEKDEVMGEFKAGRIDVLVATTVIEVGVDVPNATMMIVLDADRFGLSQLHQLRGRVGRGSAPGVCLLVSESPPGSPAMVRLTAVAATNDGFELAREDLKLRREGDVLGRLQAGRSSSLRLLSLLEHEEVILAARQEAAALIADDTELTRWPGLRAMVSSVLDEESQEFLEKG